MIKDGDIDIDDLMNELTKAEVKDKESPLVPEAPELPFRIVSAGLEGEASLVPKPDTLQRDDCGTTDGPDTVRPEGRWRDAISSSTLPFGAASLPTLAPKCRQQLEDRYLCMSAQILGENLEEGVDGWFDKTTWSRSIGNSLFTVAMSEPKSTMAVKPTKDLKSFLGNSLGHAGPFPPHCGHLDSGWEVKRVPLDGEDATGGYSVGSLEKPTARLSQYARGKAGNMNPFTPGGEELRDATGEGDTGARSRNRISGGLTAMSAHRHDHLSEEAVAASLAALDPKSEVSTPLLSVPPNVTFTEGLTPQVVSRGVPIWACQARRQRIMAARVGAGAGAGASDGAPIDGNRNGEDAQDLVGHNVLPATGKGGIPHQSPASPRKLLQAPRQRPGEGGGTIDFSALFEDMDSDMDSNDSDDSDSDGDGEEVHVQGHTRGESIPPAASLGNTKGTSQEHLSSELKTLSPPFPTPGGGDGDGYGYGYKNDGEDAITTPDMPEEAWLWHPLDSLLASEAEARMHVKSKGHQSLTEHLLKTPDERKQPSRIAASKDFTSSGKTKPPGVSKGSGIKWAVTELLDVSDFDSLVPRPAHRFPFTLDGFQKQAVARLERGECVFVAAHTSAGKTVVAEYAIALAQQHMTRVIYTSPIKALSNQKYRDFKSRFGDVGLITGDVSINPEASCLIMTTEILRSMLYRGADLIRDIEWVVFDEVHYVNDSERGVVWEEVIIMLPDHANMIFLSATTPNTVEFCDWIGRTKRKPVYVITTTYRPVPLEHHLYAGNELHPIMDNLCKFDSAGYHAAAAKLSSKEDKNTGRGGRGGRGGKDRGRGRGRGREGGGRGGGSGRGGRGGRDTQGSRSQWQSLVKMLEKDGLLPVVVFSFSKKKCQECAEGLSSMSLTTAKEKSEIHIFCASAVKRLQDQDAQLPQVLTLKEMLSRGIGVHHGGLLPILKEIVEICFSRGLVKVLFATETFAMGVNMPARTVVFNGTRKHDGKEFRDLLPGEYTQMAGRAGRRGLDKVGTTIIMCWSEPPPLVNLKMMLTGAATKLQSQFRLKWNMILNLLRVEDMSVEDMMKRSFSEFRTQRELGAKNLPKVLDKCLNALKNMEAEPCIRSEDCEIEEYHSQSTMASEMTTDLLDYAVRSSKNARSALGPRRGLIITADKLVNAPSVVLTGPDDSGGRGSAVAGGGSHDFLREARAQVQGAQTGPGSTEGSSVKLVVLALCPEGFVAPQATKEMSVEPLQPFSRPIGGNGNVIMRRKSDYDDGHDGWGKGIGTGKGFRGAKRGKALKPGTYGEAAGRTFAVLEVEFGNITSLAKTWKKLNAEDLLGGDEAALASAVKTLVELEATLPSEQHPKGTGTFVPINIASELKVQELRFRENAAELVNVLENRAFSQCHTCPMMTDLYHLQQKRSKLQKRVELLQHASSSEALSLFPDFQQRLGVLRSLGYVEGNTVQLKGRVACEINTCDELIATEMVFENVLERLDPPEIAGILSALIFQEKTQNEPPLTDRLQTAVTQVVTIAQSLGRLQRDHGLPIDPDENVKLNLNFGLVDVVYEWARGVPFYEITQITLVQEGSIVRAITRLDELCREVRNSARVIGDPTLYRKMEATSQLIKRDIVFAASLGRRGAGPYMTTTGRVSRRLVSN